MPPEQENVASSPPGAQQLQREQVDVLVGARRALRVRGGRRELGRIEHDEVERGALVAQPPQLGEDVRLEPLRALAAASAGLSATFSRRERQRVGRAVDRSHVRRAAGERGQREAAGVAERIQHPPVARRASRTRRAIVALVEVEAGLLARDDVDAVDEAVLANGDRRSAACRATRRCAAADLRACAPRRRSARTRSGARGRGERGDDRVAPALGARPTGSCSTIDIAVAIGDDAGQAVRFAVHEPAAGVLGVEACGARAATARATRAREERGVDRLVARSNDHTRARICEAGEYAARASERAVGGARSTVSPAAGSPSTRSIAPENIHGMALPQRFLAARLQTTGPARTVTEPAGDPRAPSRRGRDQPSATPNRRPIPKVTAPASAPSASMRAPEYQRAAPGEQRQRRADREQRDAR